MEKTEKKQYDAIVIGGGPGGYECAIRLRQNGLKTALVERDKLGGTCLNRGCIPTKTMLHSADVYAQAIGGEKFGVKSESVSYDYAAIVARKDAVAAQLSQGVAFLEKSWGVDVYQASACVKSASCVELSNGETLECSHMVLATGSEPSRIPIPGVDLPGVVDSTGLLQLTKCPEHIVIVGGGVIGIEFATFFVKLGVKVTIVEMLDRILGPLDKSVSDYLTRDLKKKGVELLLGVKVKAIEEGLKVLYEKVDGSAEGIAEGDVVLLAGGRAVNTRGFGLEELGLELDRRGVIAVDDYCRTNIEGVYAIGDINAKMQLAHVASAQGMLVADHIAGKACRPLNYQHIPSCVYSDPETAMVGLTEAQALESGKSIAVSKFDLTGNGKALTSGENKGFIKFIYDQGSEEILGFHAVGPRATDLAAGIAAVMESGGKLSDIAGTVYPHPTVSEAVMEAALAAFGSSCNVPRPRR